MIIIIGGGLSGLLAGYRLKSAGIPFKILEARDRIGGRIQTRFSQHNTPVEMGATWFGNQHIHLRQLLDELELPYFAQYMEGTSFFQPFATAPAQAMPLGNQPPSYRIAGGTSTLVHTLADAVGTENIVLNSQVTKIDFSGDLATVLANQTYSATKVVLALPPKLWANNIEFNPALPANLNDTALTTHTWMEDSIKVALTYTTPFWRMSQQSGTLFSNTGPVTELYDHCNATADTYALCGFVNPAFGKVSIEERKALISQQLVAVFGEQAQAFDDYNEVVWHTEKQTFAPNLTPLYPHQHNGHPVFRNTYFNDRLIISSSESAAIFPGYMEGAVVSAGFVVEQVSR
jgi:monoamine oxidase